jgi:hypothetical protein
VHRSLTSDRCSEKIFVYFKMYVYASGWYEPHGHRNADTKDGNCGSGNGQVSGSRAIYRRHKGSRRRKKFHCVNVRVGTNRRLETTIGNNNDYVRWDRGGQGHHPCKNIGDSYLYFNPGSTFSGANFGFRCNVPDSIVPGLLSGNSGHINAAGANDSRNARKTIKDQLLFGATFREGSTGTGYCLKKENLAKKIGNETCFQLISRRINQPTANQKAREYCRTSAGRRDNMCKCLNVAGSTFVRDCKRNPGWAGCREINSRVSQLQKLVKGSNLTESDFGNADCIVPGICTGNVYKPISNVPACAKKMAVCNQIMQMENVKAFDGVKAVQSCNINFGAEQAKRDREKKEAARKAADAKKAPAPTPASKKAPTATKVAAPAGAPAGAPAPAAAPGGGMPQSTKIALGVGGVIILMMFLMIMMRGGGGRRRR